MILSELFSGNLNHKNSLNQTRYFIVVIGFLAIIIALFITSIVQALLFALTVFSGAFVVPVLAGLLNFKVKKNRIFAAITVGGSLALSGKIIHDFSSEIIGNSIILITYIISCLILFVSFSRK